MELLMDLPWQVRLLANTKRNFLSFSFFLYLSIYLSVILDLWYREKWLKREKNENQNTLQFPEEERRKKSQDLE